MRTRPIVFAVVGMLVVGGCTWHPNDRTLPGQVAVGSDGYTVTATFDSIDNLVPNSTVQHDDVVIGTVSTISVRDFKAVVRMRLLTSERLPSNARFTIGQKTLLGAQFVDVVDPPRPRGTLRAGARISQDITGTYPATEQVLASVSLLLNNGGLSQISTITSELNQTLAGRVPDTRDLVRQLNALLSVLNERRGRIVATLRQLNSLSSRLAKQRDTVSGAIETIDPGLKALEGERDQLVKAVSSLGRFSTVTDTLVRTSRDSLLANLRSLRPLVKEIDAAGDSLVHSLNFLLTLPFPLDSAENAVKGDYANLFTTIDVSPRSLAGAFLGSTVNENPSMDAGDPVRRPSGLKKGLDSLGGTTPTPSPSRSPGRSTPSPATGERPDGDASSGSCGLVSALLGRC